MNRSEFYNEYLKHYVKNKGNKGFSKYKKLFIYFFTILCATVLTSFSPTFSKASAINDNSKLKNIDIEKLERKIENIIHVLNYIITESEKGNSANTLGVKKCVVKLDKLMIRSKPDKNSSPIMNVAAGSQLIVNNIDNSGDWFQVIAPTGEYGWVMKDGVE